jgi:hypothetical protein
MIFLLNNFLIIYFFQGINYMNLNLIDLLYYQIIKAKFLISFLVFFI